MMTATISKIKPTNITLAAEEKEQNLRRMMREMKTVLVAFSGGVDSAYLALIATQELGENALCVTGISPSVSEIQRSEAENIARRFNFNYLTIATDEMNDPNYLANPSNRCYFCKTELYGKLNEIAEAKIEYAWLTEKQPALPVGYYFLAISHDNLGEYMDAMANYQLFLRLADPKTNQLEIDKVNLRLPSLQKLIRQQEKKRGK